MNNVDGRKGNGKKVDRNEEKGRKRSERKRERSAGR